MAASDLAVRSLPLQDRLLRGRHGRVRDRALLIRAVRADEWPTWKETRLRMLRDSPRYFATRWEDAEREPDSYWRDWIADAAAGSSRSLFVAEEDGEWVGTVGCFVRVDPTEAQLISMWIDPAARGRGLGELLIRRVGAWATERGCRTVVLFVQEANGPAQKLYAKLGFRATGARQRIAGRRGFKLVLSVPAAELVD
jgi:ribosomal protein S18 acetylase RimI-like enzyme